MISLAVISDLIVRNFFHWNRAQIIAFYHNFTNFVYILLISRIKVFTEIHHHPAFVSGKRKYFSKVVLTLGTLSLVQAPSASRRSLISQAKMEGHSRLYSEIRPTTPGVATRGFEPPMARGLMVPVS